MIRVMFLCTANSCRSQMAEGLARELGRGKIEAYSAGLMPVDVQPRAISVMKEIGIDISMQRPKVIDDRTLGTMDLVITLCDLADHYCPVTPAGVRRLHWPIRDPVGTRGPEEKVMADFRRARDEIREKIVALIESLSH